MKKFCLLVVALCALFGVQAQTPQSTTATAEGAKMTFENKVYDFGTIKRKGGYVVHTFEFVKNGTTPLVITRIETTCACTKAEFSKKPIAVGAKSTIKITYEPAKKEAGVFYKAIRIYSNTPEGCSIITIKGNAVEK